MSAAEPLDPADPLAAPPNDKRVDAGGASAPPPEKQGSPTADEALAIELNWLRTVYQGDHVKQATFRAILMGAILGGALSLQNLFVGLKTGWGLGVAITACVLSYTIYAALVRLSPKVFGPPMSILENNAMQSTASSAGYSTGGVMTSAIAAYLIVNKHHVGWLALTLWTFFLAVLGTVMAIPMKRQMINIEQLKFPSGIAAAETLRSLHAEGDEAKKKSRALGYAGLLGAVVAWLRDARAPAEHTIMVWMTAPGALLTKLGAKMKQPLFPALLEIPKLTIAGFPAVQWTVSFEGSLILVAAGGLMGLRTTISMVVAAIGNYAILAPWIMSKGGFVPRHTAEGVAFLDYRTIVSWSLWPGAALMVTSGLLTFVLQWRTVVRAFKGLGAIFGKKKSDDANDVEAQIERVEVPPSWFVMGMIFATTGIVIVGKVFFGISVLLGLIAVALTFVLAIVACRATGETDTTPIGAMGKITQLTYGILAPGNITTNLMTASITAGAASSSADLLTDLKSGYLLGANPRKQFLAQLCGTFVGTAVVVPMFYVLVPTVETLGSNKFPAPSAQVWSGVALLLSQGIHKLHYTARWGMLIGGAIGLLLPTLEILFPKKKKWIPSSMGVGLALVIPCFNSISMFIGALMAYLYEKYRPKEAERYVVAISSGLIAGESLMGVVIMLLGGVIGFLE